jgi:hypothetical protein
VAGQTVDTFAAPDNLCRPLSYEPFVLSLARRTKTMTWVNAYQPHGANSLPKKQTFIA